VDQRGNANAESNYDYIVVGAGGAGATAAARLAEAGYRVLVLEGGDDVEVWESEIPIAHGICSERADLLVDGTGYFVHHFSDAERNERHAHFVPEKGGVFYPRGRGFGGSTRMNAMIFVRPDDVDWDRIADLTGDPDWKAQNMQQYMVLLERNRYRPLLRLLHEIGKRLGIARLENRRGHGFDGWLETTRPDPRLLFADKQLLAMSWETIKFCFRELGDVGDKLKRVSALFDPNDDRAQGTEGLALTPTSITAWGRRSGPRDRLLAVRAEFPDRLEIRSGCKVETVLLDENNEALGVRYRDRDGRARDEATRREVLLAAGSFESPAILLRSGIGAEDQIDRLAAWGVEKKLVRPGVGRSLSDRYEYGLVFRLKKPLDVVKDLTLTFDERDAAFQKWKSEGKGPYATNGAGISFQAKSDAKLDDPDLYCFLVAGRFEGFYPGHSKEAVADPSLCTLVILHENKQDKRGTLELDPNEPMGHPKINFQYHEEEGGSRDDRIPIARGVQIGRRLIERFGDRVECEIRPGPQARTLEQIASAVAAATWGHHANGTARMGRADDPMAVVDGKFNVIGAVGLRVIDASTFPDNIGSFIVSAVLMQAEKAAHDLIEAARARDAAF